MLFLDRKIDNKIYYLIISYRRKQANINISGRSGIGSTLEKTAPLAR